MIFKSITKVILAASTAGVGGVGVVAPTVAYAVESANSSHKITETSSSIYLPGRNGRQIKYDSVDAAVNEIVGNAGFESEFYIGNFSKAVVEKGFNGIKYNEVETKYLTKFKANEQSLKKAYKMGNGNYTDDMEQAISSYLDNLGYSYMDANGDIHSDLNKAQEINDYISKNRNSWGVSYYQIKDLSSNKTININPLNKEDLETFKKIAIKNLSLSGSAFSIDKVFRNVVNNQNVYVPAKDVLLTDIDKDDAVSAVYDIMSVLSNAKDTFKYNIKPIITNNSATVRSDYRWRYYWSGDSAFGLWQQRYESDWLGDISYHYDQSGFDKELENLTNVQVDEYAPYFINELTFRQKAKASIKNLTVDLKPYAHSSHPSEWKRVTHKEGYQYDLEVNGTKFSFVPARDDRSFDMDFYGCDKTIPVSIFNAGGNAKRSIDLSLNVRVDSSSLNKNEIVNKLANIISQKIVFKNNQEEWLKNNPLVDVEKINNLIYDYADRLYNKFIEASSSTILSKNQDAGYVSDSISSLFASDKDNSTEFKISKLESVSNKQWWTNNLYNSGIFNEISTLLNEIAGISNSSIDNNSYMISYNNVPVFLINNIKEITNANLNSLNDAATALKDWLYSSAFDPSKLINVSNKLKYDGVAKTVVYIENMDSMTAFDESRLPSQYSDKLKYITKNGSYTDSNLSFGQNLLAYSDDKENLRNDSGIESAVYLYNKNIDKLVNTNNDNYVESINKNNICDLDILRLYENQTETQTKKDFLENPLPTYYGVLRAYNGTFNPAVAERSIIIYQSDLNEIAQYIAPVSIPTVEISGRTYVIAKLINGDDAIISSSPLEIIKDTLIRNLIHYIKADENWIWLYDNINKTQTLVENELKSIITATLRVAKFDPNMFSETIKSFLTYEDFVTYVKSIVLLNATYVSDTN